MYSSDDYNLILLRARRVLTAFVSEEIEENYELYRRINLLYRSLIWQSMSVTSDDAQSQLNRLSNLMNSFSYLFDGISIDEEYVNINGIYVVAGGSSISGNYREPKILTISNFDVDGVTYMNPQWNGLTNFFVFYNEGNRYLIPNTDYIYKTSGGFELTGFGQIYDGQTLFVTF